MTGLQEIISSLPFHTYPPVACVPVQVRIEIMRAGMGGNGALREDCDSGHA